MSSWNEPSNSWPDSSISSGTREAESEFVTFTVEQVLAQRAKRESKVQGKLTGFTAGDPLKP